MSIPFPASVTDRLNSICAESPCSVADVEAGEADGISLSCRYQRDDVELPDSAARLQRRYLVASITKPIVAMAFLKLVAEGRVSLAERLSEQLPKFRRADFRRITLRHLLTHTSGLPDMLPENAELRASHATLSQFVRKAIELQPEFAAGSDCRYSSVGFLLLGAVIERLTGRRLSEYLSESFFQPLGMTDSWLGLPDTDAADLLETVLPSQLPAWQPDADDWGWNSRYWRTLGAPWGGLISSVSDLGRYARMILAGGVSDEGLRVLPQVAVETAISDQTRFCCGVPASIRCSRPWGYGWRQQWSDHQASFGDLVSTATVGHWGATGTVLWIDPVRNLYAAILTTIPYERSRVTIQRLSNVLVWHHTSELTGG